MESAIVNSVLIILMFSAAVCFLAALLSHVSRKRPKHYKVVMNDKTEHRVTAYDVYFGESVETREAGQVVDEWMEFTDRNEQTVAAFRDDDVVMILVGKE